MNQTISSIISVLSGGTVAILAGWIAHRFATKREAARDRMQRVWEFSGFLAELQSQITRVKEPSELDHLQYHSDLQALWAVYANEIHSFHRERARVDLDFQNSTDFRLLAEKLGRLRWEDVTNDNSKRNPRDVIAEAIKALVEFTDHEKAALLGRKSPQAGPRREVGPA
jgi:hypothetical protein